MLDGKRIPVLVETYDYLLSILISRLEGFQGLLLCQNLSKMPEQILLGSISPNSLVECVEIIEQDIRLLTADVALKFDEFEIVVQRLLKAKFGSERIVNIVLETAQPLRQKLKMLATAGGSFGEDIRGFFGQIGVWDVFSLLSGRFSFDNPYQYECDSCKTWIGYLNESKNLKVAYSIFVEMNFDVLPESIRFNSKRGRGADRRLVKLLEKESKGKTVTYIESALTNMRKENLEHMYQQKGRLESRHQNDIWFHLQSIPIVDDPFSAQKDKIEDVLRYVKEGHQNDVNLKRRLYRAFMLKIERNLLLSEVCEQTNAKRTLDMLLALESEVNDEINKINQDEDRISMLANEYHLVRSEYVSKINTLCRNFANKVTEHVASEISALRRSEDREIDPEQMKEEFVYLQHTKESFL